MGAAPREPLDAERTMSRTNVFLGCVCASASWAFRDAALDNNPVARNDNESCPCSTRLLLSTPRRLASDAASASISAAIPGKLCGDDGAFSARRAFSELGTGVVTNFFRSRRKLSFPKTAPLREYRLPPFADPAREKTREGLKSPDVKFPPFRKRALYPSHAQSRALSYLVVSNKSRYFVFVVGSSVGKHRSNSP